VKVNKQARLILQDGSEFYGTHFGAEKSVFGEVVFNTSMTGYQEMLTDPSYAGQIIVPTYPLIGNYGINNRDVESSQIQVSGFAVHKHSTHPSHSLSTMTLSEYLNSQGIPGISDIDTRAITRRLRKFGVMMGSVNISNTPTEEIVDQLKQLPSYEEFDYVNQVTTEAIYSWNQGLDISNPKDPSRYRILVGDYGLKYNILRMLEARNCDIIAMPAKTSSSEVLAHDPDGVLLSPGPGDPQLLEYAVNCARGLIGKLPIMGICLGNQILARAFGAQTFKLKFGHRGGNHPVKDLKTGKVYITAQNHGYSVDPNSLPPELNVSHINLNDETVEGLEHQSMPIMSIQYHSEASPGPLDNETLFDRFIDMISQERKG